MTRNLSDLGFTLVAGTVALSAPAMVLLSLFG